MCAEASAYSTDDMWFALTTKAFPLTQRQTPLKPLEMDFFMRASRMFVASLDVVRAPPRELINSFMSFVFLHAELSVLLSPSDIVFELFRALFSLIYEHEYPKRHASHRLMSTFMYWLRTWTASGLLWTLTEPTYKSVLVARSVSLHIQLITRRAPEHQHTGFTLLFTAFLFPLVCLQSHYFAPHTSAYSNVHTKRTKLLIITPWKCLWLPNWIVFLGCSCRN
jgi:hypothetical protein